MTQKTDQILDDISMAYERGDSNTTGVRVKGRISPKESNADTAMGLLERTRGCRGGRLLSAQPPQE